MLLDCVCIETIITFVKHCLRLGLLPKQKERNFKAILSSVC